MVWRVTVLSWLLAANVQALGDIKWGPCPDGLNGTLPLECATLPVPLDYSDPNSTATLLLNLTRAAAARQPSKGSILLNYGGPSADGRTELAATAKIYQNKTGGAFDLVAFDPRGTSNTLRYSCFATEAERTLFTASNPQSLANSSNTQPGRLWAEGQLKSSTCAQVTKDNATLLGTAFVARDMMKIVDALGEDGMLRYYGISYGTILGATVLSMFPDRVDKAILDGVANPFEYYHSMADAEQFTDLDKTFRGILSECAKAGPAACALARDNCTGEDLEHTVFSRLEELKFNPLVIGPLIVDYSLVKSLIVQQIYFTTYYPRITAFINALVTNNITAFSEIGGEILGQPTGIDGDSYPGIRCGDKIPREKTLAEFQPGIDALAKTTELFSDYAVSIFSTCAQWGANAKEIYKGDFRVRTRNPVLIISNTHDPVSPLKSGQNLTATLEGSVLLVQDGYGHTSLAQESVCTEDIFRAYFESGKLPAPGTVCPVETPLFPPNSAYAKVANNSPLKTPP